MICAISSNLTDICSGEKIKIFANLVIGPTEFCVGDDTNKNLDLIFLHSSTTLMKKKKKNLTLERVESARIRRSFFLLKVTKFRMIAKEQIEIARNIKRLERLNFSISRLYLEEIIRRNISN